MKKIGILLLLLLLCGCSGEKKARLITAEITVKDYGTVTLELYPDVAEKTVDNFVKLAESGFYDGNCFHRIMDGFMIQGGADLTGTVKPIPGEFSSNGFENDLKHTEGVISMARTRDPDSATSQFFIMVGDAEWLDGEYAAFGKVVSGYEVVQQIAKDARPIDNNGTILEEERPIIESVRILKKTY